MNDNEVCQQVDEIPDAVLKLYKTTPATASECMEKLMDELPEMVVEPDVVILYQVLLGWIAEEEKWDSLSAEAQAAKGNVPKGKTMKKPNTKKANKEDDESEAVCMMVAKVYKTTSATAPECMGMFMDGLPDSVDPESIPLWKLFHKLEKEAEEWDSLSAEAQAAKDKVPKGKTMKKPNTKKASKGDDEKVEKVSNMVKYIYGATSATASECMNLLMNGLQALQGSMKLDRVALYRVLLDFMNAEEEWDSL